MRQPTLWIAAQAPMQYRREIDGLRALAVLPVILFHAGFAPFAGGFVGVDVFFVISGYLITTVILEEKRANRFSLWRFYERRARRILPALLLVAAFCVPLANALLLPGDLQGFSRSLMATMLFVSNIYFWRQASYFQPQDEFRPLLHTWSLAVEEQFYILYPFLLLFIWRLFKFRSSWILAALTLASLMLAEWGSTAKPLPTFFLLPTRAWELLLGAMLAHSHVVGRLRQAKGATREIASAAGLGLILYSVFTFDLRVFSPNLHALLPTLGAVLILAFANAHTLVGRLLGSRIFVGIGLVSYSAYLWHQPLFVFARQHSTTALTTLDFIWLIVLVFVLACLSWRLVEVPFRQKQVVSTRRFVALAMSFTALCFAAGYHGHITKGGGFRSSDWVAQARAIETRLLADYAVEGVCDVFLMPAFACANEPEIVIWGDSNAKHLAPGFIHSRSGLKVAQLATPVCGPILDLAPFEARYGKEWSRACIERNNRTMAFVRAHSSLKYAVMSSAFDQYLKEGAKVMTGGEEIIGGPEVVLSHFLKTVEELKRAGITPVVFSPVPQTGRDIGRCLSRAMVTNENVEICDFSLSANERQQHHILTFLRALQERGVKVIFLSDLLCADRICRASLNGIPLYRDHMHFSREGSAAAGRAWDFYRLTTE